MRKTLMFGLGLATTLLATSCTKEENFNQTQGIVFSSSISSRATDTSFEGNDKIGISMTPGNTTNVLYSTEDGMNFTSATPITYDMAGNVETVDFTAVYPYREGSISNSVYNFTLSTDPETPLTENDVMLASSPGISVGSKNVSLNFKHKLVKIVVQLSDANGQPITGAQLKINNQQLAGSLNLSDATVTSTDTADDEMPFAANASISGQYQTIVMPSDPVQGRYIGITHNGNTYTLPVDNQDFVSGKKLSFTATLNVDGTVEQGTPITVVPSVSDWDAEKINSGWLLSGDIQVTGKTPKQLVSNIQLNNGGTTVINNFTGTLNQDDVYCISYKCGDGSLLSTDAQTASITITPVTGGNAKRYTLQQSEGKLLSKVGDGTAGISIKANDSDITLNEVTVYTSSNNVIVPITLWEGNAENKEVYNISGLVNIQIKEADLTELKLGAKLRIYYTPCDASQGASLYSAQYTEGNYTSSKTIIYDSYNSIEPYNNEYITVYVLNQWLKEFKENNNSIGISGTNCKITKVILIPASEGEDVNENMLWKGRCQTYSKWNSVNLWLPEEISTGGTLRVNFEPAQPKVDGDGDGTIITKPLLGGFVITYPDGTETRTEILTPVEIEENATSQDFVITDEVLQKLQVNIFNINRLAIYDENETGGLAITSVEYIPAQ